jgi:hypothetical protein
MEGVFFAKASTHRPTSVIRIPRKQKPVKLLLN